MNAILGIDSLAVSSAAALANAQSGTFLGQKTAFWGRYFYAPGQINSQGKPDSHYSSAENAFLRSNNIRLMPIARQTGNVGGDAAQAATDAKKNIHAIFESIPAEYLSAADPKVLIFLDVEASRPLSPAYYEGWAETIADYSLEASNGRVQFLPAIYAGTKSDATWAALREAIRSGSACYGAWVARYYYGSPVPRPWDDSLVTPDGGLVPPILAWQYWESADGAPTDFNFDTSVACPAHSDVLLDCLIMPPA